MAVKIAVRLYSYKMKNLFDLKKDKVEPIT